MTTPNNFLDPKAVIAGERAMQAVIAEIAARVRTESAVVVPAAAGAGKSELIVLATEYLRKLGLRVAIATPTNEQAFALVRRIAQRCPTETVTFVPASEVSLPPASRLCNVQELDASQANGAGIIVATLSKLGDAANSQWRRGVLQPASLRPVDVLLMDEAYQADSAKYFAAASIAPTHMLVGDSGQIPPFSTFDGEDRWRGLAEDPLQTAVGVLLRNHPKTPVLPLPITRRLDARAAPLVRAFYPSFAFDPVVPAGVRELQLRRAVAQKGRLKELDKLLDTAVSTGWAHGELPEAPVLTADPGTVEVVVALVARLFERGPTARCERYRTARQLTRDRVAVGVSHNDQKDLIRMALDEAGLQGVVVDTANKLQGLEFDLLVAWHPLAGLPEADPFHLDPGRLCVLLTRHRHACIVLGRAGDRALLDALPPPTPAYIGWDPDPVLDGWSAHRSVFEALEPHRVELS